VIIAIETTRNRRRFKLSVNRVYQGVFGIQRIVERLSLALADHVTERGDAHHIEAVTRAGQVAMDALDFAAAAIERALHRAVGNENLTASAASPEAAEQDFQALMEEVRDNPELKHAWEHASAAFGAARSCESKASALGTLSAGLAACYALLGEDLNGEELRSLYEESEPLVTLLLNLHRKFEQVPEVRISSPGGSA